MFYSRILIFISFFWLASEIILAIIKRSQNSDIRYENASLRLLWITIALSVNLGVYIGLHPMGHIVFYPSLFAFAGLVFIVSGLILRWIAILTLKRQFTVDVAITANHRLVQNGIYRYIRHPAYSGSLLSFLGLGLTFSNYLSILIIFVPICAAFLYRIKVEEKFLTAALGDNYLKYCQSTKQLIPSIF